MMIKTSSLFKITGVWCDDKPIYVSWVIIINLAAMLTAGSYKHYEVILEYLTTEKLNYCHSN